VPPLSVLGPSPALGAPSVLKPGSETPVSPPSYYPM